MRRSSYVPMGRRVGWVARVDGLPDCVNVRVRGVSLPRPDEPVGLLRVPATDLGIGHRRADQRVEMRRLALGQTVFSDAGRRAPEPERRCGGRARALRPERSDIYLFLRAVKGDVEDFRQRNLKWR